VGFHVYELHMTYAYCHDVDKFKDFARSK